MYFIVIENGVTNHIGIIQVECTFLTFLSKIISLVHNVNCITKLLSAQLLHLGVSIIVTTFDLFHQGSILFKKVFLWIPSVNRMTCNAVMPTHNLHEILRKNNIGEVYRFQEQRSNLVWCKNCNTTAYTCYKKFVFTMLESKLNELIHVWLDSLNSTLHRGDGIALTLKPNALTPYRTKTIIGKSCCSTAMCSGEVTAKDKYLIRLQFRYSFGCIFSVVHGFSYLAMLINKLQQ